MDWSEHVGREVIFRYHHGEEVRGVVTSFNGRFVFVRFGAASSSESCDPSMLRLASPRRVQPRTVWDPIFGRDG